MQAAIPYNNNHLHSNTWFSLLAGLDTDRIVYDHLVTEKLMFIRLLFLFTVVPVLELYVLLKVGALIGTMPTIALILLTGVAGAYLARTQGFDLLRRIQTEMAQGRLPAGELLDGAMVLVGGLLLLTPGFVTDLLGFSFLAPLARALWRDWFSRWLEAQIRQGSITVRRF